MGFGVVIGTGDYPKGAPDGTQDASGKPLGGRMSYLIDIMRQTELAGSQKPSQTASMQKHKTALRAALLLAATGLTLSACYDSGSEPYSEDDFLSNKPPQFVLLAFDGSSSLNFWKESLAFAQTAAARGAPLKFTYFASGPYFTPDAKKSTYIAPGKGPGKSDIGFGGTDATIALRYEQLNAAAAAGHEIGSHANGHFDGSRWTVEQWTSEFDQFNTLMFTAPHPGAPVSLTKPRDVVGFRAPLLANNPALYTVLAAKGFTYDTSKVAKPDYWPEKIGGVWNFPLASLNIVGSGKRTLSMDYNFYVADSRGVADPAKKAVYKKQMIDTYRAYFLSNYNGNRAPVHIGHHFSKWNGGAYWEAMQEFALEVCGKPNVRCGTYKELVAFMETRTPAQLADYRRRAFTGAEEILDVVDPARGVGDLPQHIEAPAAHSDEAEPEQPTTYPVQPMQLTPSRASGF